MEYFAPMDVDPPEQSRFSTSHLALQAIVACVSECRPVISAAGWLSTPDSAKVGLAISTLINTASDTAVSWHTLFGNSTLEALSAVTRLARQKAKDSGRPNSRAVLIHDSARRYTPFFNPLGSGAGNDLCPGITCAADETEFRTALEAGPWACVIHVRYRVDDLTAESRALLARIKASTQCMVVCCNSELALTARGLFNVDTVYDAVLFGENLTDFSVPFAGITLQPEVYATWGNRRGLAAYTSTYAGNSVALHAVVHALDAAGQISAEMHTRFHEIERSFAHRISVFGATVHPAFVENFRREKADLQVVKAEGTTLQLFDGRRIIDLSTLGCSLRGHSPHDLLRDLERYDPTVDYIAQIETHLRASTCFAHVFPSVSGAGAVDIAISLSLLASGARKKIICFSGNYSGKTLISVNFSKTAPLLADYDLKAFAPYFEDVVYVDPFAEDAIPQFINATAGNDVALVWFELVQGYMVSRLPAPLIRAIQRLKSQCGYLIGVDEVLTGMWKNCKSIFFHADYLQDVDVATLSKATSGMVFPVSMCVTTAALRERAALANETLVRRYQHLLRNNVGAFVALNSIEACEQYFSQRNVLEDVQSFHKALAATLRDSTVFSGLRAEGSLIKLNLNKGWFPFKEGSFEITLLEGAASKLITIHTGILVTNLRMFPPVLPDFTLHREILERFEKGICALEAADVYRLVIESNAPTLEAIGALAAFRQLAILSDSAASESLRAIA